jgi:hypothetical protein
LSTLFGCQTQISSRQLHQPPHQRWQGSFHSQDALAEARMMGMNSYLCNRKVILYIYALSIFLTGVSISLSIDLYKNLEITDIYFGVDRSPPMRFLKMNEYDGLCEKVLDIHISHAESTNQVLLSIGSAVTNMKKKIKLLVFTCSFALLLALLSFYGAKRNFNDMPSPQ